MLIPALKSKLHRAVVTEADLDYEGSLTVDGLLMDAAGMHEFEQVQIYNITNGNRIVTYLMRGGDGSGTICANGAAAHHLHVGDIVIVVSYALMEPGEMRHHRPAIVLLDGKNRIRAT